MTEPSTASTSRPWLWLSLVVALVVLAGAGWLGWRWWQARMGELQRQEAETAQRWEAVEQSLDSLRRDQRSANQRLQDAAATNRVLRDEMLGLSQRGALLEDTVAKLADPNRHGAQGLRLDEVELLLLIGQQRLALAGDLDGARRAYALAAGTLQGIDDPGYLNLRQALVQERNALDALGRIPQDSLGATLETLAAALDQLPQVAPDDAQQTPPWWHRLLSPLVQIRPSHGNVLVARSERLGARDSLQIELSLARAALERNDVDAWRQALRRIDAWLVRLWPDSPALRQRRAELATLQKADLRPTLPELGSTLQQLRAMREGRTTP